MKLKNVLIVVKDIERSRKYYHDLFGLEMILDKLLADYNDGRKKTLFCTAVNLMKLRDLKDVLAQAEAECAALPLKERAAIVTRLLQQRSLVDLKLRKEAL